ncbi:hypothetical protein KKE60_05435 [Patescibacteria group bacterium]|nr:hypothetical protein [Patescibacteria group bacterium]
MKNWMKIALAVLVMIVVGVVGYFIGQTPPAIVKTATVTVEVRPSPTFNLVVSTENIITYPNRTIAFNALCTGVNQFAGVIKITLAGVPAGATAEILPSDTFTLGLEPKGVQINVTFPDDQGLVGTHTLTVTATSTTYN